MVGSTDAEMFCELEKKAALVVVIGLGIGHPGTGLYVHLVGCQIYLKHRNYNRHDSIFWHVQEENLFENIDFIVLSYNTKPTGT